MNAYPVAFRKKTINFYNSTLEKNRLKATIDKFKISKNTLKSWLKLHEETGHLDPAPPQRSSKISEQELRDFVAQNSDAILEKFAEFFKCSQSGIHKRLNKLGITRKKNGACLR